MGQNRTRKVEFGTTIFSAAHLLEKAMSRYLLDLCLKSAASIPLNSCTADVLIDSMGFRPLTPKKKDLGV